MSVVAVVSTVSRRSFTPGSPGPTFLTVSSVSSVSSVPSVSVETIMFDEPSVSPQTFVTELVPVRSPLPYTVTSESTKLLALDLPNGSSVKNQSTVTNSFTIPWMDEALWIKIITLI